MKGHHMLINTGLAIHHHAQVHLPAEVARQMAAITALLPDSGLEYGVYLRGTWDASKATVTVANDIYFPEQVVTATSIQFTEDPPGPEWNVVMHRHPTSCRAFSTTDRNSINEEFLASLLFIPPWEFPAAVVNVPIADGAKLQVPAAVKMAGTIFEVSPELAAAVGARLHQPAPRQLLPTAPVLAATRISASRVTSRGTSRTLGASTDFFPGLEGFDEDDADEAFAYVTRP